MNATRLIHVLTLHLLAVLPAAAQQPDTLRHTLDDPGTALQPSAQQGFSVAVDGGLTVVGAANDPAGGVKVYDTATGALIHVLVAFGNSVAISGTRVVVGAPGYSGSAHVDVYDLASATPTVPVATLYKPNPIRFPTDLFGNSVAISGTRVVVGAPGSAGALGSAYVYDLANATPTVPVATLNNHNAAEGDGFGLSVAISGTTVVIGATSDVGSAYVYDLASATPTVPVATLNNPGPEYYDSFGKSVAVSGMRVVVAAPSDDTGAIFAGSAYVYDLAGATPTVPVAALNNPSPAEGDFFGNSVAVSGTRVVVGAHQDDTGAIDAGSAYVYDLASATPTVPVATLGNPSPASGDLFGISVAVSGTRVVVGAPHDDTGAIDAGSAYVYDLASATPTVQVATLNNPSLAVNDYFGSVGVSGTRVVVGAGGDDTGASDAGSAYVYDLASATPTVPVTTLNNPSPARLDQFGSSVAVSGTRVVVGAFADDTGASDAGSVYVYDLASATPTVPVATLNNPSPAENDYFGNSVAISGTRVVVGVPLDDTGGDSAGSAYVYDLASASPTVPVATLNNPSPALGDNFGNSVAVSGTRVIVGADLDGQYPDHTIFDFGSAYVYDLASATPTVPVATLNNPTPAFYDHFGNSVAISGTRVVVGARDDDTGASNAGSAYVYDLASASPTIPVATLNNPSPASDERFGIRVAISGTRVVVGAYGYDIADAGSVYVYDLASATPTVPVATLNNPSPAIGDGFGSSVAIDGTTGVVGAYGEDGASLDRGAAYVFTPANPLALEPVSPPQPGAFRFLLHGGAGLSVRVQRSTNLRDWEDWQPVTLGAVPAELTDPDAGAIPQRFYRAVHP